MRKRRKKAKEEKVQTSKGLVVVFHDEKGILLAPCKGGSTAAALKGRRKEVITTTIEIVLDLSALVLEPFELLLPVDYVLVGALGGLSVHRTRAKEREKRMNKQAIKRRIGPEAVEVSVEVFDALRQLKVRRLHRVS